MSHEGKFQSFLIDSLLFLKAVWYQPLGQPSSRGPWLWTGNFISVFPMQSLVWNSAVLAGLQPHGSSSSPTCLPRQGYCTCWPHCPHSSPGLSSIHTLLSGLTLRVTKETFPEVCCDMNLMRPFHLCVSLCGPPGQRRGRPTGIAAKRFWLSLTGFASLSYLLSLFEYWFLYL